MLLCKAKKFKLKKIKIWWLLNTLNAMCTQFKYDPWRLSLNSHTSCKWKLSFTFLDDSPARLKAEREELIYIRGRMPSFIETFENATRQLSNSKTNPIYTVIDELKKELEKGHMTLRKYQRNINNYKMTKKDAATDMSQIIDYLEKFQNLINECEKALKMCRSYMWMIVNKMFFKKIS